MNYSLKWFEIKLIFDNFRNKTRFFILKRSIFYESYSKPYRFDRNSKGGGIFSYVRENMPFKLIYWSCTHYDKEYFLVELNLRKQKWLIICSYNHHKTRIVGYLECISKKIDSHLSKYDDSFQLGDFNSKPTEKAM